MPALSQSPARSRVTEVIARVVARAMDVATTNAETALHCYTERGEVTVILPAQVFVRAARGSRDCNGNPFPELRTAAPAKSLDEQLADDAAAAKADLPPPPPKLSRAERLALCERAYAELLADPALTVVAAAERQGVNYSTLSGWIFTHRRAEWAKLKAERVLTKGGA